MRRSAGTRPDPRDAVHRRPQRQPGIGAQEIDLHSAPAVERNRQVGVHLKSSTRLRQRLQPSIEECLGRASCAIGAFGFRRNRTSGRHEQVRERRINAVANESTNAGSVVAFPEWISRQRHVCRPARNGARGEDNRVTDGLVAAATAIEHSRQHRHVQVGVVVDPYLTLAVERRCSLPTYCAIVPRHETGSVKNSVSKRIVEPLSDVFASRQDDAPFFPRDGCQPLGLCAPLLLSHSPSQDHDVRNACGKHTLETIEVLVAFGEDERRALVPYGLNDLLADRSIPSLVVDQELIKRLELDPFVRTCDAAGLKRGRANNDRVFERSCRRLRSGVDPMPHRTALHEDDWMMTVLARHCRGQAQDESRLRPTDHLFKAVR